VMEQPLVLRKKFTFREDKLRLKSIVFVLQRELAHPRVRSADPVTAWRKLFGNVARKTCSSEFRPPKMVLIDIWKGGLFIKGCLSFSERNHE